MDSISLESPPPRRNEGEDQAVKTPGGSSHGGAFHSHLDLSLGISSGHSPAFTTGSCCKPSRTGVQGGHHHRKLPGFFLAAAINEEDHHLTALPQISNKRSRLDQAGEELHNGFIHPWSLAARQQKAVFEQALQKHHNYNNNNFSSPSPSSPMTRAGVASLSLLSPPALVGWQPLRAFRKSLGGSSELLKAAADESMNKLNGGEAEKKPKLMEKEDEEMDVGDDELKTAMFVKVNKEGFTVGRKINLRAHDDYRSLSSALCKLFHNFLCNNYLNSSEDRGDAIIDDDFILLYEDNEGDQMLVGDIPWKLFVTSVKKLYIAHNPEKVASGKTKIQPEASPADQ